MLWISLISFISFLEVMGTELYHFPWKMFDILISWLSVRQYTRSM
jgi:hypothetical protein